MVEAAKSAGAITKDKWPPQDPLPSAAVDWILAMADFKFRCVLILFLGPAPLAQVSIIGETEHLRTMPWMEAVGGLVLAPSVPGTPPVHPAPARSPAFRR